MDLSALKPMERDFLTGKIAAGAYGMGNLVSPLSSLPRSGESVTACHVLLTQPYSRFTGNSAFSMPLHEQWTARLSALLWKRYNGPIRLITDRTGARYFREIGLDTVYDEIWDDLSDPYGLNQKKFWASGKLLAMRRMQAPCMIIDLDLLVWQPLALHGSLLTAAHIEHINDRYYPDVNYFLMSPRYYFPADWDYTASPLNTALIYIADEGLRREYLDEAFRFMRYERSTPDNGSNCMVFAEQRILAMCAARRGIKADTLLDYDRLIEPQPLMTHTWSAKRLLSNEKAIEAAFVKCCKEKCAQLEN